MPKQVLFFFLRTVHNLSKIRRPTSILDFIHALPKYITNFLLSTGVLMSYFTSGTQDLEAGEEIVLD